jgi:hypothetical protein
LFGGKPQCKPFACILCDFDHSVLHLRFLNHWHLAPRALGLMGRDSIGYSTMYDQTFSWWLAAAKLSHRNQHHALLVSSSTSCPTVRLTFQSIDLPICQRIQAAVIKNSEWLAARVIHAPLPLRYTARGCSARLFVQPLYHMQACTQGTRAVLPSYCCCKEMDGR